MREPNETVRDAFAAFAEIGIVHQLASAAFAEVLPEGLHPSHFGTLRHLVRRGDGRTMLSVAKAMQTTKANISNTLAKLENRGLVELRPNPEDGRSKLVHLTAAGRLFVEDALPRLTPVLEELDRRHGLGRVASLLPELAALRETLDEMRD